MAIGSVAPATSVVRASPKTSGFWEFCRAATSASLSHGSPPNNTSVTGLPSLQVGARPKSRYSWPVPLEIVQETWLSRMLKAISTNIGQLSEATSVGGMRVGVGGAGVEVTRGWGWVGGSRMGSPSVLDPPAPGLRASRATMAIRGTMVTGSTHPGMPDRAAGASADCIGREPDEAPTSPGTISDGASTHLSGSPG